LMDLVHFGNNTAANILFNGYLAGHLTKIWTASGCCHCFCRCGRRFARMCCF
jgi:hypothetical protein